MAGNKNILKEFLVSIGFKVDDNQWRRFDEYWKRTERRFKELSLQATAASLEIGGAVTAIAEHLTRLYYVGQRTGTRVGALQSFEFGAKQVGVSAEQATSALENMAEVLRTQPGSRGLLASFGINPSSKDTLSILMKFLDVTRRMPFYQGAALARMMGIDENTYYQLSKNYDQLKKSMLQRQNIAKGFGLNITDLAEKSRRFTNDIRKIEQVFDVLGLVLAKDFLPVMDKAVRIFDEMSHVLVPLDRKTHGWSTRILAVATALLSVNRALAAGKFGLKLLGLGGGAATEVGEGAAIAGGAEAAGGGLLATLGLPVIIGAAVVAAFAWMTLHPQQVRNFVTHTVPKYANKAADAAANLVYMAGKGIAHAAHSVMSTVHKVGLGNLVKGVASLIAWQEGFKATPYADAGQTDIGYGHKILPGEHFGRLSKAQAFALMVQDLKKVQAQVLSLVKVHLNRNQLTALDDFQYNTGALKGSTLLRLINSGASASAIAAQFMRWDHVKKNGTYLVSPTLQHRRAYDAALYQKPVTVNPRTTINVYGSDPHATAREVARHQNLLNGRVLRNVMGVIDNPGGNS